MNDPRKISSNLQIADTNPQILLAGDTPRLIDEWQIAPKLWDAARFEVDHRDGPGQFIFTGSAVPAKRDQIHHTGTGRFSWLTMRPMSLWESGESNGTLSLTALFAGAADPAYVSNELDLKQLAYLICRGGWPAALSMSTAGALRQAYHYVEATAQDDISRADETSREAGFTKRLLRSYARHQGSQASIATLYNDMTSSGGSSMSEETISSYLQALRKIFVIEDMPAWNPNLRSKSAIRTSDTRYFVDPSIAAASLGIGPDDLLNDLNTFGLLFETLVIRDLRVYADVSGGEIFHFRDRNGLECDAVIHLRNGSYGLCEIKLGGDSLIQQGVNTLLSLSSKIDTAKMKEPAFMMVLTGTGNFAYRRKDGIYIAPVGCLRP